MGYGSDVKPTAAARKADSRANGADYLKPLAGTGVAPGSICYLAEAIVGTCEDTLGEVLNAAAIAGGAVLFGFNRNGGVTVTMMVGGAKQDYPFASAFDFHANAHELADMMINYAENNLPKRLEAAKKAGKA